MSNTALQHRLCLGRCSSSIAKRFSSVSPGAFFIVLLAMLTFVMSPDPAAGQAVGAEPAIHFVVDVSGSMAGERLQAAKDAIKETADSIPDETALGLRSYAGGCDQTSVAPVVPLATNNDAEIKTAADGLSAGGGTPTTAALGRGIEELAAYATSGPKTLVLLTDGDTQCGITICEYVKGNLPEGIDLTINTVGLDVSSGAAQDLTCAAEHTGGQYIRVDQPSDLAAALVAATGARTCKLAGADGWRFEAHVSADDGLVLDSSFYKGRQFTQSVSAPYLIASYSEGRTEKKATIELTPQSPSSAGSTVGSTLESWECRAVSDDIYVKAVYKVDDFMFEGAASAASGLRVTQMYRFRGEDPEHYCEPTELLPCGRFWPTIEYSAGGLPTTCASAPGRSGGCTLFEGLTTVQRIEFRPDGTAAGAIDAYKDRDVGIGVETKGSASSEDSGESLKYETAGRAIVDGKRGRWDSIHQSPSDGTSGPNVVKFLPGCSTCVHMHWAWGKQVNAGLRLKKLNPLTKNFTDGRPQILDGSRQDAVFGIVRLEPGQHERDPVTNGWRALIDGEGTPQSKLRGALPVVFWEMSSEASRDAAFPFLDDDYRHGGNGSIFFGGPEHDH